MLEAEMNYLPIERRAFALLPSWKLKPYFVGHTMQVVREHLLKTTVEDPTRARHVPMVSETEKVPNRIHSHTMIKGQARSGFLAEFLVEDPISLEDEDRTLTDPGRGDYEEYAI